MKKGPVVFPWEKAGAPATGKRAAVYISGNTCYDAGHSGAAIADLDVIATSDTKERVIDCKDKLTGSTTGQTYTVTWKLTARYEQATAYDRITGKVLGTKLFAAPSGCKADPKMFVSSDKTDVKGDEGRRSLVAGRPRGDREVGRYVREVAQPSAAPPSSLHTRSSSSGIGATATMPATATRTAWRAMRETATMRPFASVT